MLGMAVMVPRTSTTATSLEKIWVRQCAMLSSVFRTIPLEVADQFALTPCMSSGFVALHHYIPDRVVCRSRATICDRMETLVVADTLLVWALRAPGKVSNFSLGKPHAHHRTMREFLLLNNELTTSLRDGTAGPLLLDIMLPTE
jgi:hypothetical protein